MMATKKTHAEHPVLFKKKELGLRMAEEKLKKSDQETDGTKPNPMQAWRE
jgi:hypothetical protein